MPIICSVLHLLMHNLLVLLCILATAWVPALDRLVVVGEDGHVHVLATHHDPGRHHHEHERGDGHDHHEHEPAGSFDDVRSSIAHQSHEHDAASTAEPCRGQRCVRPQVVLETLARVNAGPAYVLPDLGVVQLAACRRGDPLKVASYGLTTVSCVVMLT